jgi:hypothetical protein
LADDLEVTLPAPENVVVGGGAVDAALGGAPRHSSP